MKKFYSLLAAVAMTATMNAQTVVTQWNFDGSVTTPSTGSGTFSMIGGVVENTQTGGTSCNCGFVAGNPSTGKSYTTKTYPDQGSASGTAGVKFAVSTVGKKTISFSVDAYGSNTASKYVQLQYTTDGSAWTSIGSPVALSPSTWSTLSGNATSEADNNINFAIRVVSVFAPSTTSYAAIGTASNYAASGALRYDNVTVSYSETLAVVDTTKTKANLVKNTIVANDIIFGAAANVSVYNTAGQVVKTAEVTENSKLDVSALPKGTYVVSGLVNGQAVSQKIIKK